MKTLDELREESRLATRAYRLIEQEKRDAIRAAKDSAERNIERFFGLLYNQKIKSLGRDALEKRTAYEEALEQAASLDENAPYPIGTKMTREEGVGGVWSRRTETALGVLEVVTRQTEYPQNCLQRAEVGDYIVRYLKKDGKPGLKWSGWNGGWNPWKPCDPSVKLNPKFEKKPEVKV